MVAKKLHYREASLQVRDVFDLAVVQSHSPQALWDARDSWSVGLPAIRRRMAGPSHAISRASAGVASLARGGTLSTERLSAGSGVYRSSVPGCPTARRRIRPLNVARRPREKGTPLGRFCVDAHRNTHYSERAPRRAAVNDVESHGE